MNIPALVKIEQHYNQPAIHDIDSAMADRLAGYDFTARIRPGDEIAITVGSRGIANLAAILKAVVDEVRRCGGKPFLVPAMGSHGGGTVAGQTQILASLGITEACIGAPIRATMAVVEIGRTEHDTPVYIDAHADRADGIIAVNRIKMHTEQHNATESGLLKMLTVGLGKRKQAELVHNHGVWGLVHLIPTSARVVLARKPVIAGIAIVENALDETAHIEILAPEAIPEREKDLFQKALALYPWLPFRTLDVLIVRRIGKNISGTCMDTNLIGRMGVWGLHEPEKIYATGGSTFPSTLIEHIVALDLTDQSHGNATGVGQADVITRRLFDKIDLEATYTNVITSTFLEKAKIPLIAENDRRAIEIALNALNGLMRLEGRKDAANVKVCLIDSTLHRGRMWISRGLEAEMRARSDIRFYGDYVPLAFDTAGALIMPPGDTRSLHG